MEERWIKEASLIGSSTHAGWLAGWLAGLEVEFEQRHLTEWDSCGHAAARCYFHFLSFHDALRVDGRADGRGRLTHFSRAASRSLQLIKALSGLSLPHPHPHLLFSTLELCISF